MEAQGSCALGQRVLSQGPEADTLVARGCKWMWRDALTAWETNTEAGPLERQAETRDSFALWCFEPHRE